MILDKLVLENFGAYRGSQTFDLSPIPGKPIILIGAQNGGGKTTFLEGLQLAFFGKLSPALGRGNGSYDEALRRSMHRGAEPGEPTTVEVHFRRTVEGTEQIFAVRRSWVDAKGAPKESFEVSVNGELDRVLTAHWSEYIEEMLPPRIAPLFFFDGEKIEQFADLDRSTEIIRTAVGALLGLDIVDRLEVDLDVFERRKAAEQGEASAKTELQAFVLAAEAAEAALRVAQTELAGAVTQRDRRRELADRAKRALKAQGGDLFTNRDLLVEKHATLEKGLDQAEKKMRVWAGEAAPLLLVNNLLLEVEQQVTAESAGAEAKAIMGAVKERDLEVLRLLRTKNAPAETLVALEAFFAQDMAKRHRDADCEAYISLSGNGYSMLKALLSDDLPAAQVVRKTSLAELAEVSEQLDDVERQLSAIPAEEQIAPLVAAVSAEETALRDAEERVVVFSSDVERAEKALISARQAYQSSLDVMVQARLQAEDVQRLLEHSARARHTLSSFKAAVIKHHVADLEELITRSLQELMRKAHLISDVKIDPLTFNITLHDGGWGALAPQDLSAGERQLFAISLLWSLAKASGQVAPTVIDTPLGRLDSKHRAHLIERYFPYAGNQTILLATDEEITGDAYLKLRPFISRSMTIVFDDHIRSSRVVDGYLLGEHELESA